MCYVSLAIVSEMAAKNPQDLSLQNLKEKVKERLMTSHEKDKGKEVTNPLQPAIELMALTTPEVNKWMFAFKKFDVTKRGSISMQEIFEHLHETPTAYGREVFVGVEAVDPETGLIEFGDFMRACSIFCFFGKDEMLR